MKKFPSKIAILGVGLIGGSIAMGLKKHFGDKISILGLCRDFRRTKIAIELGIIDMAIKSQPDIPTDVKLIIIATPIKTTIKMLRMLSKIPLKNCLIMDVGSTKENIIKEANKFPPLSKFFIGTHPMAGSELSGFENASVNLFRNKPWMICSDRSPTDNKQLAIIKHIIEIMGANMILMDAKIHDELTSWASHLSLVTSSILVNTIAGHKNWDKIAKIASTGFRDTTRLASDNPMMKADIVMTNKSHLLEAFGKLKDEIDIFSNLVRQSDEKSILKYFQDSKSIRDKWITNYFN